MRSFSREALNLIAPILLPHDKRPYFLLESLLLWPKSFPIPHALPKTQKERYFLSFKTIELKRIFFVQESERGRERRERLKDY